MGQKVKVEYDMEEFFVGIKEAVKEELRPEIAEEIKADVKRDITNQVMDKLKEIMPGKVDDWMNDILRDTYQNTIVKVGGGWGKDPDEYSIEQYVTKEIKEALSGVCVSNWITNERITPEIEKYINSQMSKLKAEINAKVKEAFDDSARSMLAENVMSILMANDTYKKIESNIANIASK